ncbi:hypothetical protein Leryth_008362, partial [Lithospermum erythrorhizon]
ASSALHLSSFGGLLLNSPSNNTPKPLVFHGSQSLPLLASSNELQNLSSNWRTRTPVKTSLFAACWLFQSHGWKQGRTTYHFIVANAKFMLDEEEHFQEQLFERLRYYGERDMEQDFWLVIEPKFLDKFPNITKRLKRPAVALVSTNGPWITFMKLRLDRVLRDSFDADSVEEALASDSVDIKFEKPDKWVAPYPKYEFGWWEKFLPPGSSKTVNV